MSGVTKRKKPRRREDANKQKETLHNYIPFHPLVRRRQKLYDRE
jgi:hypothetical protein